MTTPKLLDRVREEVRLRGMSRSTEESYTRWVRRYVRFHGTRHPKDMGAEEVRRFLVHLAVEQDVAASTQNQALAALLFLYRHVLDQQLAGRGRSGLTRRQTEFTLRPRQAMFLVPRRIYPLILLSGAIWASAGCELFDPPDETEADTLRLRSLWVQPQAGYARPQPAVAGGLVYTATGDGRVIARDLETGTPRWSATVGSGSLEGANLVASAEVVVAPVVYHTVGLDAATGRELWRYEAPIDSVGGGPPNPGTVARVRIAADDEAVYLSAWGSSVAAVELRTGHVRWTWMPPPDTPFRFGGEGVTLSDGTVYAVSDHALDFYGSHCEMWVVALDARTGRQLWLAKIPAKGTISCTAGRPAVTKDRVIAMQMTGELFGLDRTTGAIVWNVPPDTSAFIAVLSSPEVYDNVVYADRGSRELGAFQVDDGKPLWRTPYNGMFPNDLLVTDKHIYGGDGSYLYIFNRRTGRLLGHTRQPREPELGGLFSATPAYADGRIIAPVADGVWAFQEP